jgi:hypothetical protein
LERRVSEQEKDKGWEKAAIDDRELQGRIEI